MKNRNDNVSFEEIRYIVGVILVVPVCDSMFVEKRSAVLLRLSLGRKRGSGIVVGRSDRQQQCGQKCCLVDV